MSKARPNINLKIRSSLLDRMAAICEKNDLTRNELIDIFIEQGCLAFEHGFVPASENLHAAFGPIAGSVNSRPLQPPRSRGIELTRPEPEPEPAMPEPSAYSKFVGEPRVVIDEAGNAFQLQQLSTEDQYKLTQESIKVTGQDAGTQLDEAIDRATAQALQDSELYEKGRDEEIATTLLAAEHLPPGEEKEKLMEGDLHIHRYVIIPGTQRTINAEPYMGQSFAMYECVDCHTRLPRPVE